VHVLQSIGLFVIAAVAEIGGAWLVWQGVREQRGVVFIGLGIMALAAYGFVATFQPDAHFGRILAEAHGYKARPSSRLKVKSNRGHPA
jgi:small multidrug resistance family-3 protein